MKRLIAGGLTALALVALPGSAAEAKPTYTPRPWKPVVLRHHKPPYHAYPWKPVVLR